MSFAQQPPLFDHPEADAVALTTASTIIADAAITRGLPRKGLTLSNGTTTGVWVRFDDLELTDQGLYMPAGMTIGFFWPHCPQGAIRANLAAAGTGKLGILEQF